MFPRTLSHDTKAGLALLGRTKLLEKAYLAGGTVCALWLGHRVSYDLDFFTPVNFKVHLLTKKLTSLRDFRLKRTEEGTILGQFKKIDFSLFYYPYTLLKETTEYQGINIASIEDIAAMKVAAIGDRGRKRDFIDLYMICTRVMTLADALQWHDKKFQRSPDVQIHLLKSLVYFDDAEKDEMPRMFKDLSWKTVKQFFTRETRKIV